MGSDDIITILVACTVFGVALFTFYRLVRAHQLRAVFLLGMIWFCISVWFFLSIKDFRDWAYLAYVVGLICFTVPAGLGGVLGGAWAWRQRMRKND